MTALNDFSTDLWEQPSVHKIIAKAMMNGETFKFENSHLEASKPLEDWARWTVGEYRGSLPFMVSIATQQRLGKDLSLNQLRGALNVLLSTWRKSISEQAKQAVLDQAIDLTKVKAEPAADQAKASNVGKVETRPADGTYTVITGAGDYRVIQYWTHETSGEQFVSYQVGSDNEFSFARCGKIKNDGTLVLWGAAYHKGEKIAVSTVQRADLKEAILFLCGMTKDQQLKAGEMTALRSGRCFICGRKLTRPSSISAGIGPHCASKW